MENEELQNVWRILDSELKLKSKEELDKLLTEKIRKTVKKFLFILGLDIMICMGLILFLLITALFRQEDFLFQLLNFILTIFAITGLVASSLSWQNLLGNRFNMPLKDWLDQRIKLLTRWLLGKYSKLYLIIIPILTAMLLLSIHVFFAHKPFTEAVKTEESIWGIVFGFFIGLLVSLFGINKIRKYQVKNLEFLKGLYSRLSNDIQID